MSHFISSICGNPPYQASVLIRDGRYKYVPIYNHFIDLADNIACRSVLITPARFLFDAGLTPHVWNKMKLSDPCFKLERYYSDASMVFPDTDIMGGVAVTSSNDKENSDGPIGVFIVPKQLSDIAKKVRTKRIACHESTLDTVVSSTSPYKLSEKARDEYGVIAMTRGLDISASPVFGTNIIDKLPEMFRMIKRDVPLIVDFDKNDNDDVVYVVGRSSASRNRVVVSINRGMIQENDYLDTYNVLVPAANGCKAISELEDGVTTQVIGDMLIAGPGVACTSTFLCIGTFNSKDNACRMLRYLKTRFARLMIGTLKSTQHNAKNVWRNLPLPDLSDASYIDWGGSDDSFNESIYHHYDFVENEKAYIIRSVKPMR